MCLLIQINLTTRYLWQSFITSWPTS